MFDTHLSHRGNKAGGNIANSTQELPFDYEGRALLIWEEHCIECAPPTCYHNCSFYQPRVDGKCVRLINGMQKNRAYHGALRYGIDCEFRPWAKIESYYYNKIISDRRERILDWCENLLGCSFLFLAKLLRFVWPTLKPYGAYIAQRRIIHKKVGKKASAGPDVFYIECYVHEVENVQLLVQIDNDNILYTKVHKLVKGENRISISLKGILNDVSRARVFLSPIGDTNVRISFRWADFFYGVRYNTVFDVESPAEKVKVVAWDLDNTLWSGILVEDEKVVLRENALGVIKKLDERGILNTIVSKNDFETAYKKLEEFGISDYFLSPAINWGQKSQNLIQIAKELNLGINSFAFIDDNLRERKEVEQALPMVRIFADTEIDKLLDYPEFCIPITEASKTRRLSYMQEASRKRVMETYADDYDSFLKSLEMCITVEDVCEHNSERCFELLARSNQLNLSTNRYSNEEYKTLLGDEATLCKAIRCKDKFGDYGIVSFISIHQNGEDAYIKDFVISCRVAKKKVEQSIIISLKPIFERRGIKTLSAVLKKTKKNGPLAVVFDDLPFDKLSETETSITYCINDIEIIPEVAIMDINYR